MNILLRPFYLYATFSGRSTRAEYALFLFLQIVIQYFLVFFLETLVPSIPLLPICLSVIFIVLTFIPSISVTVRRLHDIDLSGWFYVLTLIPFINLLWMITLLFLKGTQGENRFGPSVNAPNGKRPAPSLE